MVQDNLRVGLLTDHVPINEVASKLTEDLIVKKINTVKHSLIRDFSINNPKIAVLGLNPHCGDGGVIGKEDEEFEKTDRRIIVANVLGVLDEREKQIIRLTYLEQLSQKEVGERLGISQMHVSRIQRKALKKLQEAALSKGSISI